MAVQEEAPPVLCHNLCWLLSRASHTVTAELTAALEDLSLSPRAHHVLATAMCGEYTQIELARLVGLDKTTMVVTLDELEAAGWAERRPSAHDRRARVVAVTTAGKRKVRQAGAVYERISEQMLAALPAKHRDLFLGSLRTLVTEPHEKPVRAK